MANTFYPQSDHRPATMTVGQLIERLQSLDPTAPVIFRSPQHGCFGSNTAYSIDAVAHESLERREEHYPACVGRDEETGEEYQIEAYTQVFPAWAGVVIG